MTSDAFLILRTIYSQCWSLFISWEYPGTHATPAEMGLFLLTAYVSLRFFKRLGKVEDSSMSDKD